jgi:glycine/D-amino acid oxidase-like deaminating enzyme
MKVDIVIVGLGLAGTLLAHELIRAGKSIVVFDDPGQPKASDVAAGIINPVVLRRMTKSWMVDEAYPVLEKTYRQLEDLLEVQLYYPSGIKRILSEADWSLWKEKISSNNLEVYLENQPRPANQDKSIKAPFGSGVIKKAVRIDIQKLTSGFRIYLSQQNLIRNEKFETEELKISDGFVSFKDISASNIIFCEGPAAAQNPFFSKLKFKHSKGEVIEAQIPEINLDEIISKDVFILPLENGRYKIGSTYTWDEPDWQITESARQTLLEKLKFITSAEPHLIAQYAGIRPTMHDRKPVLGFLPNCPQIGIFNGLGSKGALLGPYFARHFGEFISGKSNLINPEVQVGRYYSG